MPRTTVAIIRLAMAGREIACKKSVTETGALRQLYQRLGNNVK
jgi:hypothetical protein